MRIISKYRDYYDSGVVYGIDKKVVFIRNIVSENFIDSKEEIGIKLENGYWFLHGKAYEPFIIHFCGISYVGYFIEKRVKIKDSTYPTGYGVEFKREIVYGEEVIEYLEKSLGDKFKKDKKKAIKTFINNYHGKKNKEFDRILKEYKVPYCLIKGFGISKVWESKLMWGQVFIDISLKEFKFQKVKDAVEAFQEISMYIPILKAKEKIRELTDKEKILNHGLDKTSFRCEAPGNRKANRVNNKIKKYK